MKQKGVEKREGKGREEKEEKARTSGYIADLTPAALVGSISSGWDAMRSRRGVERDWGRDSTYFRTVENGGLTKNRTQKKTAKKKKQEKEKNRRIEQKKTKQRTHHP
jgi:hypothetical protein